MKKTKMIVAKAAKIVAEVSLKRDANRTTCGAIYQPKVPVNLNRFKSQQR